MTEFYEALSKARKADASLRQLEGKKADSYYEKHKTLINEMPTLNQTARDIAAARREAREAGDDRAYSADKKRNEINERNQEIRRIARETMINAVQQGVRK